MSQNMLRDYYEVEWILKEVDELGNEKEVVYKEEFKEFESAFDFYLLKQKSDEDPEKVRVLSVLTEYIK